MAVLVFQTFLLFFIFVMNRSHSAGSAQRWNPRKIHLINCAMDASYGDMANEPTGKFMLILCATNIMCYLYNKMNKTMTNMFSGCLICMKISLFAFAWL